MDGNNLFKVVKLEDIALKSKHSIVDGPFGSNLKTSDYVDEGIPVLQGKNITNNKFAWFDIRFISEKKAEELSRSKVIEGDILIVKIGSIGYSAILDNLNGYPYAIIPANLAKISPDPKKVDIKYLLYFLTSNSSRKRLIGLASKTSQPALSLSKVKNFKIPLPPLPIQKKIGEVLERADAAREKRRQANALTEQFLQSAFLEMFGDPVRNPKGWEIRKFGDITRIERKSLSSSMLKPDTKYVGLEHIEKDTGRLLQYILVRETGLKSNKYIFSKDHVLYGKLRPYLNKVCLSEIDGVCSTDILPIKPLRNHTNKYFIAYLMKQSFFIKKATLQSSGANLPRISPNILKEFEVYAPPLELQNNFAMLVEKSNFLREMQSKSEKELNKLFQSLMHKAFKGELELKEKVRRKKERLLSPTDLHAGILGIIINAHQEKDNYWITLGERKGEKLSHLIEDRIEEDFGRKPKRDAAGPDDYPHLKKVHHRATMKKWFSVHTRPRGKGKSYRAEKNLIYLIKDIKNDLGEKQSEVDRIINLFLDKNTEFAEIAATVYAAWNDLLIDGKNTTDEDIIYEARENWSEEKLNIDIEKFFDALSWLRENDLLPSGEGKKTIKKNL